MKTYTLFLTCLFASLLTQAQEVMPGNKSMLFATDVVVHNKPSENQRHARTASAFNGWLYLANTINDTVSKRGGIYVSISKDNGETWTKLLTYQFNNSFYPFTDIAVAGTDSAHLYVFLAGTLHNTSTGANTVYIDKFDGRNGTLLSGQVFYRSLGSLSVTDMALNTDALYPSSTSSPFSIGLLYALHGGTEDSLLFATATDGGLTYEVQNVIAHTSGSFRHVALGYGRSPAAGAGSYYATWESLTGAGNTLGHIYMSHTRNSVVAGWNNPFCLDSLSPTTIGLCRNPAISCQQSNANNDAADLSVVVCFERASGGNMNDIDIVGAASKKAFLGNIWQPFTVIGSPENDLQPALAFNPGTKSFGLTYFDSTNGRLPYAIQDLNLGSLQTWNYLSTQYNDQHTNLKAPYPVMVVNPALQQACFFWIQENPGNQNGIILFDAEYAGLATAVVAPPVTENKIGNLYPNPATERINIPFSLQSSQKMNLIIYDMLGNVASTQEITSLPAGMQTATVDISALESGIYFCHISTGGMQRIIRFAIQH
ncbi:MAG TPA: T9SS type A sorting domain-containing protein [Bacteroidia bacterium]|jgi:hypothetical protein|nr:T9SS type A sorting domain-containing protein [Bacteroidia bacterium]